MTRAFAGHFDSVVGVDIAPSMIRKARELSAGVPGVEYVLNERPDLAFAPSGSVDLVYSAIVLQHVGQPYVARYIAEFVRVLSPRGLAMFQMPTELSAPRLPRVLIEAYKTLRFGRRRMQMHALSGDEIKAVVAGAGGAVVRIDESVAADGSYRSGMYFVRLDKSSPRSQ